MRQDWVDIIKAITMISVVLGHITYQYPNWALLPISVIIAWLWHVPVFFLVGGFFLNDCKMVHPLEFIKGKVKTLYLPILYFYIPITLMHNLLIDLGFYDITIEYGGKYVNYWDFITCAQKIAESIFLAGREPALGAMWFAYVLFMALCYICIVTYVLKIIFKEDDIKMEKARVIVMLGGGILFSIMTEIVNFTIPRFNNVFTAAWLLYVGMLLKQKYKIRFQNKLMFILCLMFFYSYAVLHGKVRLNHNDFGDIGTLTLSACSALYIVAFIAQRIKGQLAKFLVWIGRNSFYIMALHFIAFKICSLMLNVFGARQNVALQEAPASTINYYFYYAIGGVLLPLLFIRLWRIGLFFIRGLIFAK